MSVPTEFHSTLCRTYHTLHISVRQPITEVKAEWNVAADVWEIGQRCVTRIRSLSYIVDCDMKEIESGLIRLKF